MPRARRAISAAEESLALHEPTDYSLFSKNVRRAMDFLKTIMVIELFSFEKAHS